ncbi:MAG: rRNA pseudouridine synthase [Ottowia sp.]|nr:rRNA pseudouridine synthase [Ottowia sp.]
MPSAATPHADAVRLNRRMAELGLCSRREADEWIARGWVRVDGRPAAVGERVSGGAHITVDARARGQQQRLVTILLNKPIGIVSGQAERGYQPATAIIGAHNHWRGDSSPRRFAPTHLVRLAPAGRLDIDSTGLLVLTQDGRIARRIIGEKSDVDKEYLVRVRWGDVAQNVRAATPPGAIEKLRHGLALDGQPLAPAQVEWQNGEQLRFVLHEGKKRQIRRMCALVGLQVTALRRIRIGRVKLGALPLGQWRYLGEEEQF